MRAGAGEIAATITASRDYRHGSAETMHGTVFKIERDHAAAAAFVVHDQIDGKVFDVKLGRMPQRLAIERMQHGVTGAVGGGASALRGAFAVMRGHAAERTLVDFSVFLAARKWQTPMFQLVNGFRRVATEIFDSVLVTEPVGALDGIVHVPTPIVLAHVAERSSDATLRRDSMRACRKNFGDAGCPQTRFAASDGGAQA